MNAVRLADVKPQPWRNGGGSTQALLSWPQEDGWLLRVSVAAVEQDGPFSAFEGVERWFAVVHGAGVALTLPGGEVAVNGASSPLCFDGAAAPFCRLLDGPTQDLNFMVRHDAGRGHMCRATPFSQATQASQTSPQAAWRGLYAADTLTLELDGALMPVAAGTLLWLAGPEAIGWRVQGGGPRARAWCLSWSPR